MRTTTHLHWALGIALAGLTSLIVPGCYINVDEGGSDWDGWDDCDGGCSSAIEDRAQDACESYCIKLITCDALSDSSYSACVELCVDRYVENESDVKAGCSCVSEGICGSSSIEQCDGQPLPDVWDEGDGSMGAGGSSGSGGGSSTGGSSSSGGGSGTGGGSSQAPDGPSCSTNHDCALGADCVGNVCLDRCAASCQCGDGQACEDGYCQTPQEPATACDTVCDCTSGMDCVGGFCVD